MLEKLDQTIGLDETVLACSMHSIGCKTLCGTDRFWREDTVLQTRVSQTVFKLVSVVHIIEKYKLQATKLQSTSFLHAETFRELSHTREIQFLTVYT